MIKYQLICKDCKISFDSWFTSSNEYEKLKHKKFLSCLNCESKNVEKSLMSPRLIKRFKTQEKKLKVNHISKKIKEYQNFIKNNFEYVGQNFAFEARSIHYDNKKKNKGIYGTASQDEIKELKEEGITTETIPWIEDKSN